MIRNNDEAVSSNFCVMLLVAFTVILAAVIALLVIAPPNPPTGYSQCELTKTSVIHTEVRNGITYVVDSDGCTYSWYGWIWAYNDYRGHNVTFRYNSNSIIYGAYEINGIVADYGYPCNTYKCGCVIPTPVPTCGCK